MVHPSIKPIENTHEIVVLIKRKKGSIATCFDLILQEPLQRECKETRRDALECVPLSCTDLPVSDHGMLTLYDSVYNGLVWRCALAVCFHRFHVSFFSLTL